MVSLRGIAPDTLKLGTALRPLRVKRAAVDVGCAKSEACGENRSRQNENFSDIYFYFISPRAWSLESRKTRLSVQMKIGEICCKKFSARRHWCWRTPEAQIVGKFSETQTVAVSRQPFFYDTRTSPPIWRYNRLDNKRENFDNFQRHHALKFTAKK